MAKEKKIFPRSYFFGDKQVCFFEEEPTTEELLKYARERALEEQRGFTSIVLMVDGKASCYCFD